MTPSPDHPVTSSRWAWAWLALALGWVALVRVPLVLNAGNHLDSDLAVDGLTLLGAANGHWRWHYPATPFIGIAPVLLSWPQALAWGANPVTLVSGGVFAYALVVGATFAMNRRAFGSSVAAWGLVPLAFASTGTVWLSGRITGGHLLTVAWHAGAFALLCDLLRRGGAIRSAALGLWSGFGMYLDSMFAVSLVGMAVAPGLSWWRSGWGRRGLASVLAFGLAMGVGVAPRFVGKWLDPHDAYEGQFDPATRLDLVARNARILALDCLPRLVAGHRLPALQAEPDPARLAGGARSTRPGGVPWLALVVSAVSLGLFARAMLALLVGRAISPMDPVGRAIRWGLLASTGAVLAGFLVNRTIANSDNYRYLVTVLVPWSSGFGLLMARIAGGKPGGWRRAGLIAAGFAGLMAVDSARWYARFGWIDGAGWPVRKAFDDPALGWLDRHPGVASIYGDYWDVYRLSFLTGGRVRGVPFSEYPERFPEVARGLPGGRPEILIVRPDGFGPRYRARAMAERAREVERSAGLSIVEWPWGTSP